MPDRAWKQAEREAAHLIGGTRYPANSGGRVDVESARYVAQVKHVKRLSLAQLERLATEIAEEGRKRSKCGLVVLKRKGGRGCKTPRLIVMTEEVWRAITAERSHTPARHARDC